MHVHLHDCIYALTCTAHTHITLTITLRTIVLGDRCELKQEENGEGESGHVILRSQMIYKLSAMVFFSHKKLEQILELECLFPRRLASQS